MENERRGDVWKLCGNVQWLDLLRKVRNLVNDYDCEKWVRRCYDKMNFLNKKYKIVKDKSK